MAANNMEAIRDALAELVQFTCNSCQERLCESDCEEGGAPVPCSAILKARDALALPPRNCDVGSVTDQRKRYAKMCQYNCDRCALQEDRALKGGCEFSWAQMPCEEGGAS